MQKIKQIDKQQMLSLFDVQRRFVDLNVLECGREQCAPFKHVEAAAKKVFTMHIIESGKGYIEFNGEQKELKTNDIFVIFPNQLVEYYPDENTPWSYLWVVFEGIQADELVSDTGITREIPYLHMQRENDVLNNFVKAVDTYERKGIIVMECVGYLYIILGILANKSHSVQELTLKQRYIKEAIMFIHFNLQFNIAISDIAHNLRVTPNYLSSLFRQTLGLSPKQYLRQYRMERAHKLLQKPKVLVKDVALDVGYKDQLHFAREFKKYWGYSPSQAFKHLFDAKF